MPPKRARKLDVFQDDHDDHDDRDDRDGAPARRKSPKTLKRARLESDKAEPKTKRETAAKRKALGVKTTNSRDTSLQQDSSFFDAKPVKQQLKTSGRGLSHGSFLSPQ